MGGRSQGAQVPVVGRRPVGSCPHDLGVRTLGSLLLIKGYVFSPRRGPARSIILRDRGVSTTQGTRRRGNLYETLGVICFCVTPAYVLRLIRLPGSLLLNKGYVFSSRRDPRHSSNFRDPCGATALGRAGRGACTGSFCIIGRPASCAWWQTRSPRLLAPPDWKISPRRRDPRREVSPTLGRQQSSPCTATAHWHRARNQSFTGNFRAKLHRNLWVE